MRGERDGTHAALARRGQHQGERRSLRVAMPDGHAARREKRAVHRTERAAGRKTRAGHPEEGAMHREEPAAIVYVRVPSRLLRGAIPDALAGERSAFVEHRSSACTALLRLRRASRRRGRRARGGARKPLGARSACPRLSRGARGLRTASLRTGSDARPARTDAPPAPKDAGSEARGVFRSVYRSPTRGQRHAHRAARCPLRRSASCTRSLRCTGRTPRRAPRSSRFIGRSSRCAAHSGRCSTHSRRRGAKAKTPFTKSHSVITHVTGCPTHTAREGAIGSGVPRRAR